MKLQAWIYAARKDQDTPAAAVAATRAIGDELEARLKAGALAGYRVTALLTDDDFDEQDIDRALVEPVSGGTLPALYLNITYDLTVRGPGDPELDALLDAAGLEHVLTDPPVAG